MSNICPVKSSCQYTAAKLFCTHRRKNVFGKRQSLGGMGEERAASAAPLEKLTNKATLCDAQLDSSGPILLTSRVRNGIASRSLNLAHMTTNAAPFSHQSEHPIVTSTQNTPNTDNCNLVSC
ncbi:hypothetical protein BU25DRAFT_3819 [Macroventuria anomochaeta]|uniref:Uncharacterized protein n=1 Tax=Macroventuria anomochaeta TaxID=301207 RepID=A0ACB6SIJ2_9PLEO|nr:uncharacterized protein BU25DRAFT_3819 [Macroventuria anomochaeta]KAF2633327.1 hypothetical protein BU25DRAFT_3819 [Macroventuria anomochaeta]